MKPDQSKKHINTDFNKLLCKYFTRKQVIEIANSNLLNLDRNAYKTKVTSDSGIEDYESIMIDNKLVRILIDDLISFAVITLELVKYVEFLNDLAKYILLKGQLHLSEEIYSRVLNYPEEHETETAIAYAYLGIAEIKSREGKFPESILYLHKSKAKFKQLKNLDGFALCEHLLGTIYLEQGSVDRAEIKMAKVLKLLNKKENEITYGMVLVNLGIINYLKDELNEAEQYFISALELFTNHHDLRRSIEVKNNIGMIYIKKCEYEKANAVYKEIINDAQRLDLKTVLNIAYLNQSEILISLNKLLEANKLLNKSLEFSAESNDKLTIADIYKLKGVIHRQNKSFMVSEKYLMISLRLNKEYKNDLNYAETSLELGKLLKEKGDLKNSRLHLENALEYFTKIQAKEEVKKVEKLLSSGFEKI